MDETIATLNDEISAVAELVKRCVHENATTAQSQEVYERKCGELVRRYEVAMEQLQAATAEKEKRQKRDKELRLFIKALKAQNTAMTEWSDKPWILLLEKATVYHDGRITFLFKDGTEITV